MFSRTQRRIAVTYVLLSAGMLAALGLALANVLPSEDLQGVVIALIGAFALGALAAVVLSAFVARATTSPLASLTEAVRGVARGELDQTVSVSGRDEVSQLATAFNHMVGEIRRSADLLAKEESKLRSVLGSMPVGLLLVDRGGAVTFANPAAVSLLGLAPAFTEGRSVIAVVRDHELAALVARAAHSEHGVDGDDATAARLIDLGAGGDRRTVQAVASRISGGDDADGEVLLTLEDVTELRRVELVRREFVANVSHELRTPVASIKALVETLENGALDDRAAARDFVERAHVEVDGLAQLVEELLELSRVESGQVAMSFATASLADIVAGAAERLRPQAERGAVELRVKMPGSLPPVRADASRLQQVVTNLVHNAIKFTPPGGTITVSGEERPGEVVVTVEDTGVGIAPEALPRLFERFYKAERSRASGGTGLGLAIAKHVVQAHGGRIWAESPGEGRGATFAFALPVPSR